MCQRTLLWFFLPPQSEMARSNCAWFPQYKVTCALRRGGMADCKVFPPETSNLKPVPEQHRKMNQQYANIKTPS